MKWTEVTPGERWSDGTGDDEPRHILLRVGDWLRELHEVPDGPVVVHEYAIGEEATPSAAPLTYALHVRTHEVAGEHAPWVRTLDDREAFEWLAAEGYAS